MTWSRLHVLSPRDIHDNHCPPPQICIYTRYLEPCVPPATTTLWYTLASPCRRSYPVFFYWLTSLFVQCLPFVFACCVSHVNHNSSCRRSPLPLLPDSDYPYSFKSTSSSFFHTLLPSKFPVFQCMISTSSGSAFRTSPLHNILVSLLSRSRSHPSTLKPSAVHAVRA